MSTNRKFRLQLEVEYENEFLNSVIEDVNELIQNAQGYGRVLKATLDLGNGIKEELRT